MSERRPGESIAPRRTLDGPVLPPMPEDAAKDDNASKLKPLWQKRSGKNKGPESDPKGTSSANTAEQNAPQPHQPHGSGANGSATSPSRPAPTSTPTAAPAPTSGSPKPAAAAPTAPTPKPNDPTANPSLRPQPPSSQPGAPTDSSPAPARPAQPAAAATTPTPARPAQQPKHSGPAPAPTARQDAPVAARTPVSTAPAHAAAAGRTAPAPPATRSAATTAPPAARTAAAATTITAATTTTTTTPASAPAKGRTSARSPRRARLRLTQVDAWSVMKTSFLLSIALGIVLVVAVAIILAVLGAAGVWDSINSIVQQVVGTDNGTQFNIEEYVGTSRVLGFTMLIAVLDVILLTAIATLGAFLYNLAAALLGGIEVTFTEDN